MARPRLAAVLAVALLAASRAGAIGPTDIVRVDEIIDAPRALFGRTGAQVERALGAPPASPEAGPGPRVLRYPGLVIRLDGLQALHRVELTDPRYRLPHGLGIGAARADVERVLGEPQALADERYLYLYSDGYPDTVEFFFAEGRAFRIEWTYGVK